MIRRILIALPILLTGTVAHAMATAPGGGTYPGADPTMPGGDTLGELAPTAPTEAVVEIGANGPSYQDPTRSWANVTWTNGVRATSLELHRAPAAHGPWTMIYSRASAPAGTFESFLDSNARPDQWNCYVVMMINSVTREGSDPKCFFGPKWDDKKIVRAQVRVVTGNVADAGTDGAVAVALQGPANLATYEPRGNITWLDTEIDDFRQGASHIYEVLLSGITERSQITQLRVDVDSDDALCVAQLDLILNGVTAFSKTFSPCAWVENGSVSVLHDELQASPSWNAPPSGGLFSDNSYLHAMVEASIGHSLHGIDVSWNDVSGSNPVGYNVSANQRVYTAWLFGDGWLPAELEMVLEMRNVACLGGVDRFAMVPVYVDIDADEWLEYLPPVTHIAELIMDSFADQIPAFEAASTTNLGCFDFHFGPGGIYWVDEGYTGPLSY